MSRRKNYSFFMKKLLICTFILILLDVLAYNYLSHIINKTKAFKLEIEENNLIYQKKDIQIYDTSSFELLDYFKIYGKPCKYTIEDDFINISINNKKLKVPYQLLEKEVEETIIYVEKPVYEKVYVDKPTQTTIINNTVQSTNKPNISYSNSYTFNVETDIEYIVNTILNSISTNIPISLDYSFLNPNEKGAYTVYLNSEEGSKQIAVNIIWLCWID